MLNATLRLHLGKYNSVIANDMLQNLYVDTVISVILHIYYQSTQLHVFSDASLKAYEAVAYISHILCHGKKHVWHL